MNEAIENGRVCLKSQSCDYSSEEELSVLPPHTKVVVTGNNRTKSVLVGLHGVVKKAVGLGGWHWLVLTNGIDVKLQRNALSVVEPPTGNEEDDDLEFENVQWNGSDLGELASEETQKSHRSIHRMHTSTGSSHKNGDNARMYLSCDAQSKGLATFPSAHDDTQKSHRSRHRTHKSTGSSHKNDHKNASRPLSCDAQFKGPATAPPVSMKVDLSKLNKASLWRYWRYFNLMDVVPKPSEVQLVDILQTHFMSQKLDEVQVITEFAKSAKRLKTLGN